MKCPNERPVGNGFCQALLSFSLLLLSACSSTSYPELGAIFEHQDLSAGFICLEVLDQEPDEDLLSIARAFNADVLPVSACHRARIGFKTRDEHQARIIRITRVERVTPNRVVVSAALDFGIPDSLSVSEYTLERQSDRWVLTNYQLKYRS